MGFTPIHRRTFASVAAIEQLGFWAGVAGSPDETDDAGDPDRDGSAPDGDGGLDGPSGDDANDG